MHCIYLHGFASGPQSSKAKHFSRVLGQRGIEVHVPDLNDGAFSHLTLSGQLFLIDTIVRTFDDEPFFFMGSSMGGLLATMAAPKYENLRGLILLAPGFGLNKRWHELLGPEQLADWKSRGSITVFHHMYNRKVDLKYSFIEDADKYQTDDLRASVPTLVLHGIHDTVVPPLLSEKFAEQNPHQVELHLLDSDHGLLDVLEEMNALVMQFVDRLAVEA